MKKSMEIDLSDLTEIMEGFVKKLDKLSQPELIDLAARLKPIAKHCEAVDKHVKEIVKVKLDHTDGELPGTAFKALLKLVPTDRLDQDKLKTNDYVIYKKYLKHSEEARITFELR